MAAKPIDVSARSLASAASTVAGHAERAAQPGPTPTGAAGGSSADAAAAAVAVRMRTTVTAMAARLATKGPQFQAMGQGAASGLQSEDAQNAGRITAVSDDTGKDLDRRGAGVQAAGFGPGGAQQAPANPAPGWPKPKYPLDLNDIKRLAPGAHGPYGYQELVPGSGVWIPDPATNAVQPGFLPPGSAKYPLDLNDIKRLPVDALGPRGYMELIPHSGIWVPDPHYPGSGG
ncbi:hypothetical protein [uncultured Mycobacterium sp.]|uniref:hypothetical protein n=1 Tax=uncultured Mycobacterium sp. TaxID=171292 RepID=UPI0035CC70A2